MHEALVRADAAVTILFLGSLFAAVLLRRDRTLRPYAWSVATVLSVIVLGLDWAVGAGNLALGFDGFAVTIMILCVRWAIKKNREEANS